MRETWVQFLGWEDLLEKEMAVHSSILAWRIPWKERSLVDYSPRVAKSQTLLRDFTYFHFFKIISLVSLINMITF